MKNEDYKKILLVWLAIMWIIFSSWAFAATQFPLNFAFAGFHSLMGVVMIWTLILHRDI